MQNMGMGEIKGKRGLIRKTWERCRSFGSGGSKKFATLSGEHVASKSKSWPCSPEEDNKQRKKHRIVPEGCFSIYVGPQRQRFVIKTSCINHPLFKMLLEEAELEYGHKSDGPLVLPCAVDVFYNVLAEMDDDDIGPGCNLSKGYGSSYHLVSLSRLVAVDKY